MPPRIRKQVYELSSADFEAYPYWEYAMDEEGREGQNECTVRPLKLGKAQPEDDHLFVQAAFFFPNGRVRLGHVTLNAGEGPSGHQPIVFIDGEAVAFYNGALEPSPKDLKVFLRKVRSVCPDPWPIAYVSVLRSSSGEAFASGQLSGMYWLADWRKRELRVAA